MIAFLAKRLINMMETRLDADMGYLRALNAASPRGFDRFLKATALARHCEAVPLTVSHAARLTATAFEDCGPCVQIAVGQARAAGLTDDVIKAVLEADRANLPADIALAHDFTRSILVPSAVSDDLRQAVRARWGEAGVVDLAMATQGSRLFPMIKRGLGYAQSCQQVRVGAALVAPAR